MAETARTQNRGNTQLEPNKRQRISWAQSLSESSVLAQPRRSQDLVSFKSSRVLTRLLKMLWQTTREHAVALVAVCTRHGLAA